MSMKIKVTEERWCCQESDLVKYLGELGYFAAKISLRFCRHCGQLWRDEPATDAAGGRDTIAIKVFPWKD